MWVRVSSEKGELEPSFLGEGVMLVTEGVFGVFRKDYPVHLRCPPLLRRGIIHPAIKQLKVQPLKSVC
jgi:hypothetical protein